MKEFYGIDVSSNNGTPNWSKVTGISFAILRATQRYGIDSSFKANYDGAKAAGLKVGVYRFSYALSAEESRKEAEGVISTLDGRKLDFPVFLDLEWENQRKLSKSVMFGIISIFREVIEKAGYKFGIYCNTDWYANLIPNEFKENTDFWIANVPSQSKDNGSIQERLRPSACIGWQYSWKKTVPGFAKPIDADVFYTDYSDNKKGNKTMGIKVSDILNQARNWLGKNEYDGSHRAIIDIYNAHKPLARGYKVKYTDQWCDTCVSALFISLNAVNLIGGTECGVEEHVKIFKNAGIWIEDGNIVPKPGDIIVFNWDKSYQPNDGYSDHIGIVEKVSGNTITTIEGNYKDSVARRTINVGWGYIRGYARPKYQAESGSSTSSSKTSASSASTSSSATSRPTLRRGSKGVAVKDLQNLLNKNGYLLAVDGDFGLKTYCAVTSFQSKNGLAVDGVVGVKTWAKLDSTAPAAKKSVSELAKEVLDGKWGNAPDRKKNLESAGYNYQEVQNAVNKMLQGK